MTRSRLFILWLAALMAFALVAVACGEPAAQPTPAPAPKTAAPTVAPAAPAATPATKAPAAATPATKAPAATPATAATPAVKAPTTPAAAVPKPQGYPSRQVTIIVPWDAGGSTDVGFRVIAPVMERIMGQPIQIVNRPGAGSQVGVGELARARPDGYTFGNISAPAVQTIYLDPARQATFDADSFAFTALHVFDPGAIIVRGDSPYQTLQDLLDDVEARPGQVTASTTGVLGDDHLAILLVEEATNLEFAIVHFTGGAPALTALLGGHTNVQFGNVGDVFTRVQDGTVRILAVMDEVRNDFVPDVPTVEEEIGHRIVSSSSRGLAAPAGTPEEIVRYVSDVWRQAMEDPEVERRMAELGLTQRYLNPQEFEDYWREFQGTVERLMPAALKDRK
jgi:tripartite-type tricarboxylate transporter receptor subunit TctC